MVTAAVLAYLTKLFGPTLARLLLATLLKGHVNFDALGYGDLAETLADGLDIAGLVDKVTGGDRKAVRNANYLFDKIGDEAAEKLMEVFQGDGSLLDEAEWRNTIDAAKATLNQQGLRLLIAQQLNAHDFRRALRNTPPAQPLETAAQEEFYRRLLDTAAQVVFAIADTLPHFTRDTTAQLLQNEARLLNDMTTVLANQQRILAESYSQQKGETDRQFESEYRTLIASELDNLQLFGVEPFDGAKQPLSVAYIKLRAALKNRHADAAPADDLLDATTARRAGSASKALAVEEVLQTHNRLLIVSDAGSGKTTLLQWITVQAARRTFEAPLQEWAGRLPFFIRLRDFTKTPLPTFGRLATAIREVQPLADSVPERWVEQQLQNKRGLVLLDGMDEVSNAKRQEALAWLERLLRLYPETIVIVSSRPSGLTDPTLGQALQRLNFDNIELLKLDNEQVVEFVEQWHAAMVDDRCRYLDKSRVPTRHNVLLAAMEKRKDLKSLASSPILCSMLCALNLFELGKLPEDRIRLYDRCINILLRRDENREVDSSDYAERLRPDNVRRRLARIAYWMMQNDPAIIRRPDAERLLQAEGLAARPVLDFLAARSVIFREQAVDEFAFIHRTFLEYLTAQEIVHTHEVKQAASTYGAKSEWRETLRLLAGHVEPEDQAILLSTLYMLAQQEPAQRYSLHLLAWEFWDLLDSRTSKAMDAMIQHLRSLSLHGAQSLDLSFNDISDVTALAALTNLQQLDLSYTQVSDVTALAALTNLQQLDLSYTQVSDVTALAALTNLQQLTLYHTQVSDVTVLTALTNLQQLDLSGIQVSDVTALAALTNLQQLDLSDTRVSDVTALAALTNLQQLDLSVTRVSDVTALAALTNLQQFYLSGTQVSDVTALAALTSLQQLDLSATRVSDVTALAVLTNLRLRLAFGQLSLIQGIGLIGRLGLRVTKVSDVTALATLTNLQQLTLSGTKVSDVTALAALTNLQQLTLSETKVGDVTALAALTNLQQLTLSGTLVSDVTALVALTNLQQLDLFRTPVSDVTALAALTNLQHLYLSGTPVSDVTALAALTNLQHLYLSGTPVSDVTALTALTNLQQLDLSGTQVSDITALAALTNLRQLTLSGEQVRDVTALAALTNLQRLTLRETQVSDVTDLRRRLPNLIITS